MRANRARPELRLSFEAAVEATLSGVSISDPSLPDNPLVFVNPAFTNLTGYGADDCLGENCRFLQGPDTDPATVTRIRDAIAARQSVRAEILNYRKDGRPFWNDVVITPVFDAGGDLTAFVGIQNDITQRKSLEHSNRELEQFAYVASHDLKAPLKNIKAFIELLRQRQDRAGGAETADLLDHVDKTADRMTNLMDDLLSYARIGARPEPFEAFRADELLATALENLDAAINENDAEISHAPLPEITCNGPQIMRVFQNLVGNAIAYRRAEAPRIHIAAETKDDDWLFSVADNGVGVEERHRERIFRMFQRTRPRGEGEGTGIGLALCKKIVNEHGGTIWVTRNETGGSTFFFTLRRQAD